MPITIDAETAKHVGVPKFLLPASENVWLLSFFNLVHRTTSHGGEVSVSAWSRRKLEATETLRLWLCRKAGDDGLGLPGPDEDMRDWNRRSKGRKDGVGLLRPGREAMEGSTLLPGEDMNEPWVASA